MTELVYLNGEYIPAANATVPILDRGFMFGDGVYEVIPVYRGRPFRQQQHMERLQRSLVSVDIPNPLSVGQWEDVLTRLIQNNCEGVDAMIYLQVTRGVMQQRDHVYSEDMQPTVLVMCQPREYTAQKLETDGIKAVTLEDNRWADCHIKSINLLPNVMLKHQAIVLGAIEAILIRNGNAIEGSASNLFIVKDDVIRTPPKSRYMLGGITRDVIIELCHANRLLVQEKEI
jgi:D-alanine transaminase